MRNTRMCFFKTGRPYRVQFVFLVILILSAPVFCESWECVGPSGGYFLGSVTNPADASQVTVITNGPPNVYRSMDSGSSWSKIGEIPTSNYILSDISAFDFSTIYAIAGDRCYRSTDGGVNWSYANVSSTTASAYHICVNPVDSNKVYAVGRDFNGSNRKYSPAFFKSTDGGRRWTVSLLFSFDYFYPYNIAVSRSNPDVIYIVGYKSQGNNYYGALFKSTDGGTTWTDISSSVENAPFYFFYSVAVDPDDAEKVYIGGDFFIYRSERTGRDHDLTWTRTPIQLYALSIAIDPVDHSKLYTAGVNFIENKTAYSVGFSTDYGQSWTLRNNCIQSEAIHVEVADAAPSTVYISTYNGFFKSIDSGDNWHIAHKGIHATIITAMAIAPSQPSTLIVEYDGCGLMGSYDSGANWDYLGYFVGCGNVCDIIINPDNADTVLALEGSG
ncbi:MAG: VPS10 domain-containing protein [Planctomycetota bacterium]